jgi:hypothetical protein
VICAGDSLSDGGATDVEVARAAAVFRWRPVATLSISEPTKSFSISHRCLALLRHSLPNAGQLAIVPTPRPPLDEFVEAIAEHDVTTLWLTAGLFNLMFERRLDGLKSQRPLIVGGDAPSPPHFEKALAALARRSPRQRLRHDRNHKFTRRHTIARDPMSDGLIPIGSTIRHRLCGRRGDSSDRGQQGTRALHGRRRWCRAGLFAPPKLTAEKFVACIWNSDERFAT